MIRAYNIDMLWMELVMNLLHVGEPVAPRAQPILEVRDVQLRLLDPRANILFNSTRRLNYRFMVAEWLWMWFGREDVDSIVRYNPKIAAFSDDGLRFHGAYGPRIARQWIGIRNRLRQDPDTRQAVIQIFDGTDLEAPTKDVPCTLSFQYFNRGGALYATVNMRSSDVWLGLPYDIFNFTMLQNILAGELGLRLGDFTINLGSSHLYDVNREQAAQAMKVEQDFGFGSSLVRSPMLPGPPPLWLEWVLVGDRPKLEEGIWRRYASVLQAGSRTEALEALRMGP